MTTRSKNTGKFIGKDQLLARQMKSEKYGFTREERIIKFYREHPVRACEEILGIKLLWYQRKALRDIWFKSRVVLKWSRGASKSWELAVFAVLRAILFCNQRIGIIGPTFRQTGYVFNKMMPIRDDSAFFRACIRQWSFSTRSYYIELFNSSFIEGLPIGKGDKIRGARYTTVLLDEMNYHDQQTIDTAVRPFLIIKSYGMDNKLVMASTPGYKNQPFWAQCQHYSKEAEKKPDKYSYSSYNFTDMLLANRPDIVEPDMEEIKDSFGTQARDQWLMEYAGFFPPDSSSFFSTALVSKCEPRISPITPELEGDANSEYVMGVDPARSEDGDRFALVIMKVLQSGLRHVVYCFAGKGIDFVEQMNIIRRIVHLKGFSITKIFLDYGGGGAGLADLLMQKWHHGNQVYPSIVQEKNLVDKNNYDSKEVLPILEVLNFTVPLIDEMYTNLKADMEHSRVVLPISVLRDINPELEQAGKQIDMLKSEMTHVVPKATTRGLTFQAPAKPGKDRLTACVLANHAINKLYAKELGLITEAPEEVPVGFWIPAS